jgi:starch synthase
LEYADRVTTVSPTYAKEIIATRHEGLVGDVLKRRASSVVGLLNGLDTTIWDPATDPSLSHHYNATTVDEKKVTIKADLQRELGLPQTRSPLIAFVGRLEPRQKGIDIIIDALSELLPKKEMQMVILGTGDRDSCEKLVKLALKHKDKFVFKNAFDEPLARRIYAGADIFLVPSKFEPCGLTQMIAMRYGTVPVVRKTGGLADSVDDGKTGFVFEHYSGAALAEAIMRAVHMWETDEVGWKTIIQAAMHADFSWHKSAALYIDLYRDVQKG